MVTKVGTMSSGDDPTNGDIPTPNAIPKVDAKVVCDPAFAVISAKFVPDLELENERCIPAREAEAANHDIFIPTLAKAAIGKNIPGASGVNACKKTAPSSDAAATTLHLFGSESNRLFTRLANKTPPN